MKWKPNKKKATIIIILALTIIFSSIGFFPQSRSDNTNLCPLTCWEEWGDPWVGSYLFFESGYIRLGPDPWTGRSFGDRRCLFAYSNPYGGVIPISIGDKIDVTMNAKLSSGGYGEGIRIAFDIYDTNGYGIVEQYGFYTGVSSNWITWNGQTQTVSFTYTMPSSLYGKTPGYIVPWIQCWDVDCPSNAYIYNTALYINSDIPPQQDNPPIAGTFSVSTTLAGQTAIFMQAWTDDYGLSQGIFSYKVGSGAWSNKTAKGMSGQSYSFTDTLTLPGTSGTVVYYKFYAKDNANQWTVTSQRSLTTTATTPQQWSIIITAGNGGTVKPSGTQLINVGQSITVTASPSAKYAVDHWVFDTGTFGSGSTVTVPSQIGGSTHSLTVIFKSTIPIPTPTPSKPPEKYPVGGSGFNVYFTVGQKLQFQNDYLCMVNVTSGTLYGTGSTFTMRQLNGELKFNSQNAATLNVTFTQPGGLTVTGASSVVNVRASREWLVTLTGGKAVTIKWQFKPPAGFVIYDISFMIGMIGLVGMFVCPLAGIHIFRGGDKKGGFMIAFIATLIMFTLFMSWVIRA